MQESLKNRDFFPARVLLAALPIAATFVLFAVVRSTGKPFFGVDAQALGLGAEIEFIVLHSIAFLGLLALVRPARSEWAMLKWLGVVLLGAMYLNAAFRMGGIDGLLLFLSLTIATYLGFFLRYMSSGAAVVLAVRWVISLMLIGVAAGISGISGDLEQVAWSSPESGLRFGQWFFGLLLAVELTGLYQLRVWDDIGEMLSSKYNEALPVNEEPWLHRIVLGLVPLFGTALLCALPLLVAQAIGAGFYELVHEPYGDSLDERIDWMRAQGRLHEWGPVVATGALLAGRSVQISFIASVMLSGPALNWWHLKGKIITFILVGLAYIATCWSLLSNGTQVVRPGVSPGTLYWHFVLIEMFLLLALVPLSWLAIVRRLRSTLDQEP